jgi:hypothetical protein
MKCLAAILPILYFCCALTPAFAKDCDTGCQMQQIDSYFKALDKISAKGSSIKEIDHFLSILHPDVKYIHVEYAASFDRTAWRQAFIRNLERGAYQNSNQSEQRVLTSIAGKNHVAVEYAHGVRLQDGTWQQQQPLLILFGFNAGQISLVKELW